MDDVFSAKVVSTALVDSDETGMVVISEAPVVVVFRTTVVLPPSPGISDTLVVTSPRHEMGKRETCKKTSIQR